MYAHEAVEVVDVQIGGGQQACSQYLHGELYAGRKSQHVVDNAHGINKEYAYQEINAPKVDGDKPAAGVNHGYGYGEGYEHARHERHPAEPRHGVAVHFARVGQVVQVF